MRAGHERTGRGRHGRSGEEKPSTEGLAGWLTGRLPEAWFEGPPAVTVDRDEIVVVGRVAVPPEAGDGDDVSKAAAEAGRITRFREETREQRIVIAREAEHHFGRSVAWGVEIGQTSVLFTNQSVPVMTRLRQPERLVLDTLVDSGVARSRADALAWCVKLVAANSEEWLRELRAAMEAVETVRQQGPTIA